MWMFLYTNPWVCLLAFVAFLLFANNVIVTWLERDKPAHECEEHDHDDDEDNEDEEEETK